MDEVTVEEKKGDYHVEKKRGKRKKKRIFIAIPIILLALAIIVWRVYILANNKPAETTQTQRLSQVTKGDLVVAVNGSSPLQPIGRQTVSADLNTTILEILHKNGDEVKTGDILMKLDSTDAGTELSDAQNNLDDAIASAETTSSDISGLAVSAPFTGIVSDLTVKTGDTIQKNGLILTLTDTTHLKVIVPYGTADSSKIEEGQTATLLFASFSGTVEGKVSHVGSNSYVLPSGGKAVDIEIEIINPGALTDDMSATVTVSTAAGIIPALSSATLEYTNSKDIQSDVGGDVIQVSVRNHQIVQSGTRLLILDNSDLTKALDSEQSKINNLATIVENAQDNVDACIVRAPMDGTVTGINSNIGDSVKVGTALCSILDITSMTMEVSIDELDITTIIPGQSVTATVDAIPATLTKPLTGTVSSIAVEGASSNGVTTYPVTLTLNPDKRLKSGMNADASILVTNKQNILLVPIEAVTTVGKMSFVYVSGTPSISPSTTMGGMGFPGNNAPGSTDAAIQPGGDVNSPDTAQESANQGTQRIRSSSGASGGTRTFAPNGTRNTSGSTGTSTIDGSVNNPPAGSSDKTRNLTAGSAGGFSRPGEPIATGYYTGATMVMVEIGEHNETYMEILNGLTEADQIVLPALTTTDTASTAASTQSSGFSIPGMGGGFSGGTPPDGATRNFNPGQ